MKRAKLAGLRRNAAVAIANPPPATAPPDPPGAVRVPDAGSGGVDADFRRSVVRQDIAGASVTPRDTASDRR
jgi:hypothetical protein